MRLFLPFAAAFIAIVASGYVSVQSLRAREQSNAEMMQTYELQSAVRRVVLLSANAETGQRGYLLTGKDEYLQPYLDARKRLGDALDALAVQARPFPVQAARAARLRGLAERKLAELDHTVALYRRGDTSVALAEVEGGLGIRLMSELRALSDEMAATAESDLDNRRRTALGQARRGVWVEVLSALVLFALAIAAALLVRGDLRRREEIAAERARTFEYQERLISIVGHDLRNPLSAILISCQSMLNQPKSLTEPQIQALQRVRRGAMRINSLAALLIDFTHARLGRGLPLHRARTDAREVVQRTVDELRAAHPDREIRIEGAGARATGEWDAERLAQLVANLGGNALRYGREGGVVTVTLADAPGDQLELRVHNHGEPIPPGTAPRLFEPYQRGEKSQQQHQGGLGLGLYIVREIVRAHGGEVEVHSTADEGTTFVARLPRTPPAQQPAGRKEA